MARQLILTGRPIDARRAYEVGLVNVLAEPGAALVDALALAREICANAPVSVRACLQAVNSLIAADDELGWQETSAGTGRRRRIGRRPRRRRRVSREAAAGVARSMTAPPGA